MNQHINSEHPCIGGGFSGGRALRLHLTWRNAEVAMVFNASPADKLKSQVKSPTLYLHC